MIELLKKHGLCTYSDLNPPNTPTPYSGRIRHSSQVSTQVLVRFLPGIFVPALGQHIKGGAPQCTAQHSCIPSTPFDFSHVIISILVLPTAEARSCVKLAQYVSGF